MAIQPAGSPGFHVVPKFFGQTLFAGWNAFNSGGSGGHVSLQIDNLTMGTGVVASSSVAIQAGEQRLVSVAIVSLINGFNALLGSNAMLLHMINDDTDQVVAQHNFTVALFG